MKMIEIDRDAEGFKVTFVQRHETKTRTFATEAEAQAFGWTKAGARGSLLLIYAMTPEQRAARDARTARLRALAAELRS